MAFGAVPFDLTPNERRELSAWARAGTTPQRLARRARLILGSAAGLGSRALARQERLSRSTVRRWHARFRAAGCGGLPDRPRSGRPPMLRPTTRALLVALACARPAARAAPLSRDSVADLTARAAEIAPSRTPEQAVFAIHASRRDSSTLAVHNLDEKPTKVKLKLADTQAECLIDSFEGHKINRARDGSFEIALGRYGYRWLRIR